MAKPKQPAARRPTAPSATGGKAAKAGSAALAALAAPALAPPPASVRIAVKLMYAGAVLSALDLIVTLATIGKSRSLLRAARPHISQATFHADIDSLVAGSVVVWLITIALWVVMAQVNLAGRGWARIASTFLCVASTLSFLAYLGQPTLAFGKVILIPLWLAGAGAVVLLWRLESTAYIRAETALARARQS
jgi:hypothetical protein